MATITIGNGGRGRQRKQGDKDVPLKTAPPVPKTDKPAPDNTEGTKR